MGWPKGLAAVARAGLVDPFPLLQRKTPVDPNRDTTSAFPDLRLEVAAGSKSFLGSRDSKVVFG